ncbi:hypothetical protein EDB92DRAFT_1938837 [Lactarius akahatsu]|uniref:Uncharacterized protein n=1 Tax=Lactarius akahatsu TaxID=416441 RepID=A0AAD4QCV3_9AGAM|nr:hypothetical protein EDB92DRAFT_1938837 [Lactarius akahatsu]
MSRVNSSNKRMRKLQVVFATPSRDNLGAPLIPHALPALFVKCLWPPGCPDKQLYGHLNHLHLMDELVVLAVEVAAELPIEFLNPRDAAAAVAQQSFKLKAASNATYQVSAPTLSLSIGERGARASVGSLGKVMEYDSSLTQEMSIELKSSCLQSPDFSGLATATTSANGTTMTAAATAMARQCDNAAPSCIHSQLRPQ